MRRLSLFVLLALIATFSGATGQTKAPPAKAADPATPKFAPGTVPAGYTAKVIEGFTLFMSDETLKNDTDSKLERKPIQALELELQTVVKLLPPDAVKALRNVLIWVDWDKVVASASGRAGAPLARYYGGHQLQMLEKGEHALKAKAVSVLRMKGIAELHQPKNDVGHCFLLHELAHAVHYELLGRDNAAIQALYKQALERKLYDLKAYVSTSEAEYFAELTCAYFDQLSYYPRTRADLKKHDPAAFAYLERIWGKRALPATETTTAKSKGDPDLKLDKIDLGKAVMGPPVTPTELKDKPVLIFYWNATTSSSMSFFPKVNAWDNELGNFGLSTLGVHLTGATKNDFAAEARNRGVTFPITESRFTSKAMVTDSKDFPHAVVFEHTGECVFRGPAFEAEEPMRVAVGKYLLAAIGKDSFAKSIAPLAEAIGKGKAPATIFPQLASLAKVTDAETAEQAKLMLEKLSAGGERTLTEGEALVTKDPVAAYMKLEKLPAIYKGSPLATKATDLLTKLRKDKGVQFELRARTTLAVVQRMDVDLSSRPGSFDPRLERFRTENGAALKQLQETIVGMKKTFPNTKAVDEAVRIGEKYSLAVK
ncbi:hypothetical protein AYO44_06400 [Planctomycetaceae bacterium SCGC AG-212-F19]|nr:hypothetical protein AYO44_06400 [Planctomycetaceae bacterium SCGC AG-212-F19]